MPPSSARPRGFTLIELLVVVAILSAASLLAFAALGEDRAQLRYDDTRNRLKHLRAAMLGSAGPAGTNAAAAGYVADNGHLPDSIAALLTPQGQTRAALSPLFVPNPDDATCTGATGALLTDVGAQLIKGHRGDYLGGLAFNGRLRDGWGNVGQADDVLNSGWAVASDDDGRALSITSLGSDNTVDAGNDNPYAAEQTLSLQAADWLVPLAGWTVTVRNARIGSSSANDILPGRLSVSLLVFVNDAGGGTWRRYATQSLPCLDGDGDGEVAGVACARTASVAFIDGCKPGVTVAGRGHIPQGRHLLVLTDNGADNLPWTADDVVGNGPTLTGSTPILTQVDALAGHNLPAVTLEIR